MPKVSVEIPCYNCEKYIEETMQSVVNQTYTDWEIVAVDDGSTDNSKEVIQTFFEKQPDKSKFRYIYQANRGPSVARNTAIRNALGEYIMALECDDLLAPTCLAVMAAILDENPQIGIVGANVREVEADLSPITWGPEITITYDLYDPREVQGLSNCVSPMAMYRKSVWETVGGYNEDLMDCAEDWDFWLRCIDHNQTYQKVEQVLYTCRHREGSRSAAIYNRSKDRLRTETNQVLALHNLPLR